MNKIILKIKELKKITKTLLIIFYDYFVILYYKKNKTKKTNKLVMVKVDALGDFILATNPLLMIKEIKKNKPIGILNESMKSYYGLKEFFEDVIFVNTFKYISNLNYRLEINKIISRQKYDVAINLHQSRNILLDDSIMRNIDSDNKYGHEPDKINYRKIYSYITKKWYTKTLKRKSFNEIENNNLLINELFDIKAAKFQFLPITKNIIEKKFSYLINKRYVVIFPGASDKKRRWSVEKFINCINSIVDKNYLVVVCGKKNDIDTWPEINNNFYINLLDQTNLNELIEIIRGSELVITNETSAVHIAAHVGVKSICITGGGHYGRFVPYPHQIVNGNEPIILFEKMECFSCNWKCKYNLEKYPCINDISDEKVIKLINAIL